MPPGSGRGPLAGPVTAAAVILPQDFRHPGLNDSFLPAPTPDQDPELAAALREPVGVIGSVLAGMDVDPNAVIPLIRALRASVHGFVDLELRGGFGLPDDIDDSFSTTIDLVIEAIAAHSNTGVGS